MRGANSRARKIKWRTGRNERRIQRVRWPVTRQNVDIAAGLAGINAISNLIGGGLMVNVVGVVKEWTGSFVLGMLPLALLCAVAAASVLVLGRSAARAADVATVKP